MSARTPIVQQLIQQKLDAFAQLESEFTASFCFVQEVHGQKRFSSFPVASSIRYLHSLWTCECKDRLFSIYKNIERYEGQFCLELLRRWQEGDSASVIYFLQRKLDMLPLGDITRQLQEAASRHLEDGLLERLVYGRHILLHRGMNLMQALDAIFSLSEQELMRQVHKACEHYGHQPAQIERQLADTETPLYSYVPHQTLAQRNMVVMNRLGVDVMNKPTDQPGQRSWRVLDPVEPLHPFAEHVIQGYQELRSPTHNNLKDHRFIDRPERSDAGEV